MSRKAGAAEGQLSIRSIIAVGASAAAIALSTAPAMAQEAADEGTSASGNAPIIVTAQFREQNLQDTPLSITAVTGDLLDARSQTSLAEIANQAPSVTLRPLASSFGPSIAVSIRGLGQRDFNPLVEPGVGIYIDDVYYPRLTGANFELMDVERVEILRGPQGTLTGRNSEGGAIRYVSKRPDGTFGGYVQGTYGSRDLMKIRGAVQFPLGDALSARISGTAGYQDGYVDGLDYGCLNPGSGVISTGGTGPDCKVADYGDVNYEGVRGILRYNPSSSIDIMLTADWSNHDTFQLGDVLLYANNSNPNILTEGGLPLDSRFICGPYCNYARFGYSADNFVAGIIPGLNGLPLNESIIDNRSTYEAWGVSLNADIELSDRLSLASITGFRHFDSVFSSDADAAPTRVNATIVGLDSDFFSQEIRLNYEASDWLDLTIGGYYSDEHTLQDTLTDIRYVAAGGLPIFPLQFLGGGPVDVKSMAAFATAFIKPTDSLTITLGGRYTDEEKTTTYRRVNYDGVTPNGFVDPVGAAYGAGYSGPDTLDTDRDGNTTEIVTALNGLTGGYKGDRFDYRVSLDYRLSDQVLVYATTSTGFKGGGISPRPFNAAQAVGFGAEELTAYEVGIKTDLLDRRVRFNASAYVNKFKGAQLTLTSCPQFGGPGPCALPQNAGDATITGIEAELSITPTEGFDVNASLSYFDWKWDCVVIQVVRALNTGETNSCSSDPAIIGLLSAPPQGIVDMQFSFGAQYRFDIGNAGSLTPRFDVSYQGDTAGGARIPTPGSPSQLFGSAPDYVLTNARLTYRDPDDRMELSLGVTNLFDVYYLYSTFDLVGAGGGLITGSPGRPREWSLSAKYNF
ncbi:MAG: TonB-dependent receptor [Sphingomonadaceae bacterium]|nr:TonB-dependent receptor [Sphingomonadaceae bacterium]